MIVVQSSFEIAVFKLFEVYWYCIPHLSLFEKEEFCISNLECLM